MFPVGSKHSQWNIMLHIWVQYYFSAFIKTCTFVCCACWLCSWHMLQIDNLKALWIHERCSVTLCAHLFLLDSPIYAAFFWCYPDKPPAAVSVTSHSHPKPSCCLVTAHTIVSSHNTDAHVRQGCLPISSQVLEAETVVVILTRYLVCWFLTTVCVNRENFTLFPPASHVRT